MFKDYYTILDVAASASADEIKLSWHHLAQRYHPDKHQGNPLAEERFVEIEEAYRVLSDPDDRAAYDKQRHAHYERELQGMEGGQRPAWRGHPWIGASVAMPNFDDRHRPIRHVPLAELEKPPMAKSEPRYLRPPLLVAVGLITVLVGAFLPWATVDVAGHPTTFVQALSIRDSRAFVAVAALFCLPIIRLAVGGRDLPTRAAALCTSLAVVLWSGAAFVPPVLDLEVGSPAATAMVSVGWAPAFSIAGALVVIAGLMRLPFD